MSLSLSQMKIYPNKRYVLKSKDTLIVRKHSVDLEMRMYLDTLEHEVMKCDTLKVQVKDYLHLSESMEESFDRFKTNYHEESERSKILHLKKDGIISDLEVHKKRSKVKSFIVIGLLTVLIIQ